MAYIKSRAKWNQSPAKGFSSGRYYFVRAEYTIIIILLYTHRIRILYIHIKGAHKGTCFYLPLSLPPFFFLEFFNISKGRIFVTPINDRYKLLSALDVY